MECPSNAKRKNVCLVLLRLVACRQMMHRLRTHVLHHTQASDGSEQLKVRPVRGLKLNAVKVC